jgi:hypothetical protein
LTGKQEAMGLKNSRKISLQMYAFTYCSKFNRIGI